MKGHRIRWYGILSDGTRVPRTPLMHGRDWGWDATCSCGFDTRTGGAIQERVRESVRYHLWDMATPVISIEEIRTKLKANLLLDERWNIC